MVATPGNLYGIRPSINLKPSVQIVDGTGTENNPYRLAGENDRNLSRTLLNTRYSGEYITFGTGENNLYRIVSHETNGLTKITSAEPLKNEGNFLTSVFESDVNYANTSIIGNFLNGDYLTTYVGNDYRNMIEENTTWYLGTVGDGESYKNAKYSNTIGSELTANTINSQVGLLRLGELMVGQFDEFKNNINYWILTIFNASNVRDVDYRGYGAHVLPSDESVGIRPAFNLKFNVIITGGTGTKQDPFEVALE